MGLFRKIAKLGSRLRRDDGHRLLPNPAAAVKRRCRIEAMERRVLLAADLQFGAVYYESDVGNDHQGDVIEVTFEGGVEGTELTRVVIDGDKFPGGFSGGDVFFDTAPGGLGDFAASPLEVETPEGFTIVDMNVVDGGSDIEFLLDGFNAGETLRFTIDADEINSVRPDGTPKTNAIVEGAEFEDSLLQGTFEANNFETLELSALFVDHYDDEFTAAQNTTGLALDLLPDRWEGSEDQSDRTAGAVAHDRQQFIPASISGYVYHDRNDDGIRDPGEEGIGGVEIQVIAVDTVDGSTTVHTTTTATAGDVGFWEVTGLAPGEYRVVETRQPDGFLDGKDTPGTIDGVVVGASVAPDGDELVDVQLGGGDAGVEYNFGEIRPSSIGGHVHYDPERDCETGPNDVPLENVQIDLLDQQGNLLDTTFTDANGEYRFENLRPGTYQIVEHQPADFVDGGVRVGTAGGQATGEDTISQIVLTAGTVGEDYNFCEHLDAEISGFVYHDRNDDGIRDPGEEGISGVRIEVVAVSTVDGSTGTTVVFTDENGFYRAAGLVPGQYRVVEAVQPAAFTDGKDTPGTVGGTTVGTAVTPDDDRLVDIELEGGDAGIEYNFGEIRPASISGHVHYDPERDKEIGPDDVALENVRIDLLDSDGNLLQTTFTDADGFYRFDGLRPGTYQVFEHQPAEFADGGERIGSAGGTTVGDDTIGNIVLTSGTAGVNYDFCEHLDASISGFVYHDENNDGVFDPNEAGIEGVTLKLMDAAGNDTGIRAVTDSTGFYEFTALPPGVYGVMENQPDGWIDGLDTPGNRGGIADNPGDMISGAILPSGVAGEQYNFGELLPGSIRGQVHSDPDGDCMLDPGEETLAGVVIELLDEQGEVIDTTTTNAQGEYEFTNLAPGTYSVRERQPEDYFQGGDQIGSGGGVQLAENHLGQIEVGSGEHLVGYDFCELPPAAISGFVFQDGETVFTPDGQVPANIAQLRDGVRTPDDTPLAGVVLELRHGETGEPIMASEALPGVYAPGPIRTVTDAGGFYQFEGLRAGTYAVYQVHPDGFVDHVDTAGSLGGLAVNGPDSVSPSVLSQLAEDPAQDAILQIPLAAGKQSVENNFSEVRVEKPPVPPPPVPPNPEPPLPVPPDPIFSPLPPVAPFVASPVPRTNPLLDGAGGLSYTWHLSVVDAGQPRSPKSADALVQLTSIRFDVVNWQGVNLSEASWTMAVGAGEPPREDIFGTPDAIPVVGDFNGDGRSEAGVYIDGEWFIDVNGNRIWDESDLWAKLGDERDLPVTGDWDGDGKDDIGIFGPEWPHDPIAIAREPGLPDPENHIVGKQKNVPPQPGEPTPGARMLKLTSSGRMRSDLIDHVFRYGKAGDIPIAGDWNGDGIDTIGVFNRGYWRLDADGNGRLTEADLAFQFGQPGDLPVIGDFNGDGIAEVGVFRSGRWLLDTDGDRQLTARDKAFAMGGAEDTPVVGDWDGDGVDDPGFFHRHITRQARAGE